MAARGGFREMAQFLWRGAAAQWGRSDHRKSGTVQLLGRGPIFLRARFWLLIDLEAVEFSTPLLVLFVREQKGPFIHTGYRFGLGPASKVIGLNWGPSQILELKIPYDEQQATAQQGDGVSLRGDVGCRDRTLVLVTAEVEASQKAGRMISFTVRYAVYQGFSRIGAGAVLGEDIELVPMVEEPFRIVI